MSTWNRIKSLNMLILLLLAGCRGIPTSYQGEYEDKVNRVWLDLYTYEATMRFPDGRKVEAKLEEMKMDLLAQGKRAIYARPNALNNDLIEIYWLQPNMSTKQDAGGLVWYESEIVYTMIHAKGEGAQNITLVYCPRGVVMLDMVTNLPQMGCPEETHRWQLQKTRDRGNGGGDDGYGGA